jgi:hypothetical protein
MRALGGGREPIVLFSRHQHELAPTVPSNLHGLTLGLMLKFTELALEFQGSGLDHNSQPSLDMQIIRIIHIPRRDAKQGCRVLFIWKDLTRTGCAANAGGLPESRAR